MHKRDVVPVSWGTPHQSRWWKFTVKLHSKENYKKHRKFTTTKNIDSVRGQREFGSDCNLHIDQRFDLD
jgi:hypothetical protein